MSVDIDPSIAEYVRRWATTRSDAPCMSCDNVTLTWGELHDRASRLAHGLAETGVGPQDRVVFLDKNNLEFFEITVGSAMAGAVTAAVNWRLAPREMLQIINHSTAKVLFLGEEFVEQYEQFCDEMTTVEKVVVIGKAPGLESYEDWLERHVAKDPLVPVRSDETAMQMYTSGTTGLPKGVLFSNRAVLATEGMAEVLRVDETSTLLISMPVFHSAGASLGMLGIRTGAHSVIARDAAPATLLSLIARWRITMTTLVPAVLKMLIESPEINQHDFSSLDTIAYAASPISPELLRRCLEIFDARFLQIYGLTETQSATNLLPEDHLDPEHPDRILSVGRAIPGVTLRVVDPATGDDVDDDVVGEVWIKAPTNMHGYWRNEEATRDALTDDGFVRTGDGASMRDGYLYLRDRLKDMIVSGAENVYPIEIENILIEHPAINDIAVIGVPSNRWGETVKAMVVLNTGATLTEDEVIAYARANLAAYKCPTSVEFLDELPRNPSGKILKRVLRLPYWNDVERHIG
ncbi:MULTISPECIES: long-chain-fatty-acid--CoA ligase [Rhodococcus]|uniref:long-chain-fatty-acid--CoA ligase n=1 Tax=Rhodococcus TaxID=1827 RepID=UPI00177DD567|nr:MULTISPECIES: long-chain-fatty-acid--CoA ligase [Rhodococcus]MCJ0949859.1 long-chain-fatty-acid--CoA ligase [Rhodococcus sp. ARC_M8]MCQ4152145.1 long-chain-fatty-acid--CoA ligase [Rhodococcus qingshengii]MDJ0441271.1 long-chain-fatty-acid--CoA ligase [Rhodococcus qingshengii]